MGLRPEEQDLPGLTQRDQALVSWRSPGKPLSCPWLMP